MKDKSGDKAGNSLNSQIDILVKDALGHFFTGDFDESLRSFKAAEVLDRDNPEVTYNIGVVYCRLGLYKTAGRYFERLIKLKPASVRIFEVKKLYAFVLIKNKAWEEALTVLDENLKDSPSDLVSLGMKGYCLEKTGEYAGALKIYRTILEYDRNSSNSYNSLAWIVAVSGGNTEHAVKLARAALKSDPENPAYLDTLGYIYVRKGMKKQALEYLSLARKNAPFSEEIKSHIIEATDMR